MRQGSHSKRHRGRSNGRRSHGLASSYESNGPDVKIKGSAAQLQERYENLAREAVVAGDRVAAESYLQHAEHYQRIINAHVAAQAEANANGAKQQRNRDGNRPEAEDSAEVPAAEASGEAVAEAPAGEGKADSKADDKSAAKPERPARRRGRGRAAASAKSSEGDDPSPPESAAV
jgi:hypothetical protein